jgi:D-alanyl-D-alanine carboxypeptidase
LFGKKSKIIREIASLTKVMTLYTVKKLVDSRTVSLSDVVTVG